MSLEKAVVTRPEARPETLPETTTGPLRGFFTRLGVWLRDEPARCLRLLERR